MVVWPFEPLTPLLESNQWLTDIIQSKTNEQRFAMRQNPRQSFLFTHSLDDSQYQAARSLLRANESFYVPDWTVRHHVGAIEPSSLDLISYGLPYMGIRDGDKALLWESSSLYEIVTVIQADSSDVFYLDSVTNNYSSAYFMPLRTGQSIDGLIGSRTAQPRTVVQIEFELTDSEDIGDSNYSQYQSDDLISECPIVAAQVFSEGAAYPLRSIDPAINYPELLRRRDQMEFTTVMRWHVFSDVDLYSLRQFIHSRRGRWKSFWLSSFRSDFVLSSAIGAADNSIAITVAGGVTDLGVTSFDIEIAGTYRRRVTSYSVDSNGVLILNINSPTGAALGTDSRVSRLRHLRFDADRIEFNHAASGGVSVSVPCREVAQ